MKTGILVIFQKLNPVSIGFTLALAFLPNSVLSNDNLTLTNKLILVAFSAILVLVIAVFESSDPAQKRKPTGEMNDKTK
jgi:hypothetical protein